MTALELDTDGFLTSLGMLERRFDDMASWQSAGTPYDRRRHYDRDLLAAAGDVFGSTAWTLTICIASLSTMTELVRECRRFLGGSELVVRRHGMAVWLYDLINDAARAAVVGRPSSRMPMCINMSDRDALMRRCIAIIADDDECGEMCDGERNGGRGGDRVGDCAGDDECGDGGANDDLADGRRGGKSSQQGGDMLEHVAQMHRLAAYSMLRWGSREPKGLEIAQMLLTNPDLGMSMLREDDEVVAMGATKDTRYRRAADYLKRLRAQSDLEYARAVARGDVWQPDGYRAPGFAEVDTRYLYDARRIVRAYVALWDEPTDRSWEVLERVEFEGVQPEAELWRNTVFLDDLARSLMGPAFAADLVTGFEDRDRERFDEGVGQLKEFAQLVYMSGFTTLPFVVLDTYATDLDDVLAMTPQEREIDRRALGHVGESMAVVALSRMPDDDLARRAALTLISCKPAHYMALITETINANMSAGQM